MSYAIGPHIFHVWDGPPPPQPQQRLDLAVYPGFSGLQAKKLGEWGDRSQVMLTAYHPSYAQAVVASSIYMDLPEGDPMDVIFEDISYFGLLGVLYLIPEVKIQRVYAAVVCGDGINYANAGVVQAMLELIPAN